MSDSVRHSIQQPTRLPRPWDSPGKNTGVGCHLLLQCTKVKSESEVAQSCLTLSDPMEGSLPGSSALCWLRIKATFLIPPNSWSLYFYSASEDRESQDLGPNITKTKQTVWCAQLLSYVQHIATTWTVANQAPLCMGFFRQEY